MKCTNSKCGKEFKDPLIRFNGDWHCPFCKEGINPEANFEITRENQELFSLAHLYYLKALKTTDRDLRKKYIEKTVDFCDRALKLKHPEAYVLKAYLYDKDYVELNLTEASRCKIAYKYYSAVCLTPDSNINAESGTTNIDFTELKYVTAVLMMTMLSNFEESEKNGSEYKFDVNMKKLRDLGIQVNVKKNTEKNAYNRVANIHSTILNCNKNQRAPLFGYYYLEGSDLVELFRLLDEGEDDHKKILYKDVTFAIIQVNEKSDLVKGELENDLIECERLSGKDRSLKERILDHMKENPTQKMYAFLVNTKPNGHAFFKKGDLDKIEKTLAGPRGDYILLRNMINNSMVEERTFYDDDVYFFVNRQTNVVKAVNELRHNIGLEEA